jgi:hypothetical protein
VPDPADMSDPPSTPDAPVTRSQLETILDQKLAPYPTRVEFHQTLEAWANRIIDLMTERMDAVRQEMRSMRITLDLDLANHVKSANEEMRQQVSVIDDKYADLPARVTALETKRRRRSR